MIKSDQFKFHPGKDSKYWFPTWFDPNPKNFESQNNILSYLGIDLEEALTYQKLMDHLTEPKVEKKLISVLSDYDKIPQKLVNDYRNNIKYNVQDYQSNCNHIGLRFNPYKDQPEMLKALLSLTDQEIKEAIMRFVIERYNKRSILDYDLQIILINGWDNNALTDTDPREDIWDHFDQIAKDKLEHGECLEWSDREESNCQIL